MQRRQTDQSVMTVTDCLLDKIKQLLIMQSALQKALFLKYPDGYGDGVVISFPKTGEVVLNEDVWRFQMHGNGICYKSSFGIVIDQHQYMNKSNYFDTWRIEQYLESVGEDCEHLKKKIVQLIASKKVIIVNETYGLMILNEQ